MLHHQRIAIEVGPTPSNEDSTQVGHPDYAIRSRREAAVYIRQLQRIFHVHAPTALSFVRRGFAHDLGRYHEVVAYMNSDGAKVFSEDLLPATGDHIARADLAWSEIADNYRRRYCAGDIDISDVPDLYRGSLPDFPDHPVASWMAVGLAAMPLQYKLTHH